VAEFFARMLFEDPWADPDLPSLVATEDGRIVGAITIGARRMRLGSRPVRLAVCGNLAVTPDARRRAVGVRLLQRALRGPQDATISDTASDAVRRMWIRLGGTTVPVSGVHWVRPFAPGRLAAELAGARVRRPRGRRALARLGGTLDLAGSALAGRSLAPPPAPPAVVEPLDARSLLAALPSVARGLSLQPAYDDAYLRWLFDQLERMPARGRLVAHLVHHPGPRRPAGWYAYRLCPGRRSDVLAVAAPTEAELGLVLDHLISHAHRHGAAGLRGRFEPSLVGPLVRRGCLPWYGWPSLLHTADAEIGCAVLAGDALLTRLEGEWSGEHLRMR
jgi:GNAT superfamily N-acetyltransferase